MCIRDRSNRLLEIANDQLSSSWESDWIKKCVHIGQFVKIKSSNERLEFLGIDLNGQMVAKNNEGELIKVQESSIEVDGIY